MSGNLIRLLLALTLGASSTGAAPRPVPGDPDHKFLIIPGVAQVVLSFSTFLLAAWLGCVSINARPARKI